LVLKMGRNWTDIKNQKLSEVPMQWHHISMTMMAFLYRLLGWGM
jgi:hypothetical protein